jgi:large conductance mechanosensitive channel
MLAEFREFILRGNLVDLAVAVVIGTAFTAVVTSMVEDLVTPLIAAIGGEPDFSALTFTINGSEFRYGDFINALITFVSVAAAVYFFIVVPYQKYKRSRGIGVGSKRCPECTMDMPEDARRCPHCTAQLGAAPAA